MKYRFDKKSGNKLSVLGYGCMRFPRNGSKIDLPRSTKLLHTAIERGVNYLDTAYIYPGSEHAVGKILEGGWRDKVYIATKLPLFLCRTAADIDKYFNKQLETLQTDHIDYYLMHMLSDTATWQKLCGFGIEKWIEEQKKRGRIRQLGFSYHGGRDEFAKLIDAYNWDFCQIQYNYMDENNQAGKTGLQKAAAKNIPVIVMEPLLGGRLANGLPPSAKDIFKKAKPDSTPAEWALKWIWNHSEVTSLLSGMSDEAQLEENLKIADTIEADSLTQDETNTINKAIEEIRKLTKVNCTACGYCMPCPAGVDIPMCFSTYNTSFAISKSAGTSQYMQNTGGLTPNQHYASLCTKCGKCEQHCPQNIQIRQSLESVARRMEPFWFKPAMSVARTFMGVKKNK